MRSLPSTMNRLKTGKPAPMSVVGSRISNRLTTNRASDTT